MSLQIWLPLNGDLHNQGIKNVSITNNGATINDNGKIGKCYQFGASASQYIDITKEAMTSCTTEASVCFWFKILTWNTSYATYFQAGPAGISWQHYTFGLLRNASNSTCCFTISNGTTASNNSYLTPAFDLNKWYHISLIYKTGHCLIYINGQLYQDYATSIVPNFANITRITLGMGNNRTGYQANCLMNDLRIYNNALSARQIKEISKGLVLHYPLSDKWIESTENLITTEDCLSSTYYNGATSKYSYGTSTDTYKIVGTFQGKKCTKVYNKTNTTQMQPYVYINNMFTSDGTNKPQYKTLSFDYYTTISTSLVPYKLGSGSGTATYKVRNTEVKTGSGTNQVTIPVKPNMWNHIQITFHGTTEANSEWGYIRNLPTHTSNTSNYWLFANMQLEEKDHATGYAGVAGVRNTSIVYDTSGYQNNLNKNGTYSYTSDTPKYEVSTVFNGTEWMNGATPGAEILTLACWAKTSKNKSTSQFIIADSTSGLCISFYSGTIISYFGSGSQSTGSKCTLGSAYKENDWNHFVVVKTGAGTRTVYCNGVEQTATSNDYWSSAAGLFIGSRKNSASLPFYGEICDVRAYATALSAEDVLSLYNNGAYIDQLSEIHGKVR